MRVRQIMTQNVACCTPNTNLAEVARMMAERDCGAIPVIDGEGSKRVIGIVTDRDIAVRAVAQRINPLDLTAADCMTQGVVTIAPDADVEECCTKMEEHQVRRIPVADGDGSCCGIVAQADIARQADEHETAEVVKDISQPSHAPTTAKAQSRARRARES